MSAADIPMLGPIDQDPRTCRRCGAALDLHQPDARRPNKLLGACPGCGKWHVLRVDPDRLRKPAKDF
jgi:hypothetical protein